MENKFQTSFIPKAPIVSGGNSFHNRSVRTVSFFSLICVIIFITIAVLAAGVFTYEKYLVTNIKKIGSQLTKAKAALEPNLIKELQTLDQRIESSKRLMNGHYALSTFFEALEINTLKTVRFSSFSSELVDDRVKVSMTGEADNFSSVALQSDIFLRNNKDIQDPLFSSLNLDTVGNVTFKFSAVLDPSFLSYTRSLTEEVTLNQN